METSARSRHRPRKAVEQGALRQILGMPLHGQDPWGIDIGGLDGFDQAVLRPCAGAERRRQIADGLVMPAVDGRRAGAEGPLEERSGLDANRVTTGVADMSDGSRTLAWQVLIQ